MYNQVGKLWALVLCQSRVNITSPLDYPANFENIRLEISVLFSGPGIFGGRGDLCDLAGGIDRFIAGSLCG